MPVFVTIIVMDALTALLAVFVPRPMRARYLARRSGGGRSGHRRQFAASSSAAAAARCQQRQRRAEEPSDPGSDTALAGASMSTV